MPLTRRATFDLTISEAKKLCSAGLASPALSVDVIKLDALRLSSVEALGPPHAPRPWDSTLVDLGVGVGIVEGLEATLRSRAQSQQVSQSNAHRGVDLYGRVLALRVLFDEVAEEAEGTLAARSLAETVLKGLFEVGRWIVGDLAQGGAAPHYTALTNWFFTLLRAQDSGLLKGAVLDEIKKR